VSGKLPGSDGRKGLERPVQARPGFDTDTEIATGTHALVIGPYLTRREARQDGAAPNLRETAARLDEAVGLAAAISLDVVASLVSPVSAPRPATYLGKGKVEELRGLIEAREIGLVVMDTSLSPVQQRNLERAWGTKVIDRTGLILEIFGQRARTREGALQVELAHLAYQKSRLVRSWTHLERQRGGFGFLGGPGETQIEADRRLIQDRMVRIEKELESVKRTRALHREGRRRTPYPIVALVGYTNAGKSTLFNRLTAATVMAEDLLFATLDPTARVVKLPHGAPVILSDTVGFISDLPTMLVAAFRATLEDVIEADIILHVRDVSHGDTEAQAADVTSILRDLGIDPDRHERMVEVWNKADLMPDDDRLMLANRGQAMPVAERPVLISALTGQGMDQLLAAIEARLAAGRPVFLLDLEPGEGGTMAWLYQEGEVLERRMRDEGGESVVVRIAAEKEPRLKRRVPGARRIR
jgi:GTP-binding protein HflX